jgi:hypothetical protein
MSMTRANAQKYVGGIIGGARSSQIMLAAEDAILRSFEDWQAAKFWRFLLKDTARGFRVTSCVTTTSVATIPAPSTGAFDAVNIGITVTGTGIAASTTVTDYSRNTDGTVATITVSPVVTTGGTVTLTFGGNIPIIAGTQEYNAPQDFQSFYHGRTLVNKWPLSYIEYREWNRAVVDHTVQGIIEAVTIYNPDSELTQNYGTKRLRTFRISSQNDIMFMQYYRIFSVLADPLDIPDDILYKFLDYAQWRLVEKKTAHDDRLPGLEKMALGSLAQAMANDEEETEDEDVCMKSQMEMFGQNGGRRPLWSNGAFDAEPR